MKSFWLFRSNIRNLEYYHQYKTLEEFEKKCHDYYMLLPIWLLRNGHIDEAVVWRLTNKPKASIDFNVDGKLYSQRWVSSFSEVLKHPSPEYSLFRGGFKEYDSVTSTNPNQFGKKLYLGTGKRVYPQYGGKYDAFLQEDQRDVRSDMKCLPFYKTASPHIFHPIQDTELKYDLCWPANFTQHRYKGQRFFMSKISKSPEMKRLKIIHCGNKPEAGRRMAKSLGITNIKFAGLVDRPTLNRYLNESKFGVCVSNLQDGCPRVVTEILMAGTPLIGRKTTRLLPYYKKRGFVPVGDNNIVPKIINSFSKWEGLKIELLEAVKTGFSFERICEKNIELWERLGAR